MEWCRACRGGLAEALANKLAGGKQAQRGHIEIEDLHCQPTDHVHADLFGGTVTTADRQFQTVADLHRAIEQRYGVTYQTASAHCQLVDLHRFSYQRLSRSASFAPRLNNPSSRTVLPPKTS
jgi:hypothetical protein